MQIEQKHLPMRYDGEVKWLPMAAARVLLRVSRQRIYQLLGISELSGMQVNGTWLISLRSIEARIALLRKQEEESDA